MAGDVLVGPHAVLEALRAGRRNIERIFLTRERPDPRIAEIVRLAKVKGIPIKQEEGQRLRKLAKTFTHQGVLAVVSEAAYEDPFELVTRIKATISLPLLVLLDGIQDPQNLGAIIRTGEAAGVDALFFSKHRAAGLTPAAARASAGAVEHLPVARVSGLPAFLKWLNGQGIWILGAEPRAPRSLYDIDLCVPLALVIGGEHRGLTALVRERCDLLAFIPMRGRLASLNAAASAAVFLFEVRRQRDSRGPHFSESVKNCEWRR
jgi:23S rRNA (guanosine2251-2'-O)-methyltransferase